MRLRAFSLIEVMMASSIALIVVTVATSLVGSLTRQIAVDEVQLRVDNDLKILIDRLAFELRNAGGNGIALRSALRVANNSPSTSSDLVGNASLDFPTSAFPTTPALKVKDGTDILTLLLSRYDEVPCPVSAANFAGGQLSFLGTTTCCTTPAKWVGRNTALVDASGTIAIPLIPTSNTTGSPCSFTFAAQSARLDAAKDGSGNPVSGLTLALSQRRTAFYVNASNQLVRLVENFDSAGPVFASSVFADGVGDFEVSLGFDSDANGGVQSAGPVTTALDEWLFNAATDTNRATLLAPVSEMRMLGIGVTLTTNRRAHASQTVRIFDGPAVTSANYIRGATARMTLRNYPVFE